MTAMYVAAARRRTGLSARRTQAPGCLPVGRVRRRSARRRVLRRVVGLRRPLLLAGRRALERGPPRQDVLQLEPPSRSSRAVVSSFCGQIWSKAAFRAAPMSTAIESR